MAEAGINSLTQFRNYLINIEGVTNRRSLFEHQEPFDSLKMPEKEEDVSNLTQEGQDLLDGCSFSKTTRNIIQVSSKDQDQETNAILQKQAMNNKSLSKQLSKQTSSSSKKLNHQSSQKHLSKQFSSKQISKPITQSEEDPMTFLQQGSKFEERMLNEQEHSFIDLKFNGNLSASQAFLPTSIEPLNIRNLSSEISSQPKQQLMSSSMNRKVSSNKYLTQIQKNINSCSGARLSTDGPVDGSVYPENEQLPNNENSPTPNHSNLLNTRNNVDDTNEGIKLKNQLIIFAYLLQFVKSMLVRFMYRDSSMLSALQYKIIGDSSIVIAKSEKRKIQQMQSVRYRNIFERIKYLREINFLFSKANTSKHRYLFLSQFNDLFLKLRSVLKKLLTKFPIIKPNSGLMISWDITFLLLTFLLLAAIPIQLAFDISSDQKSMIMFITYVQLFVFTFDIFLGFHSGFYEFGEIVMIRKRIQHEYFQKKLYLTFFSTGLVIASIVFELQFLNFFSIILRLSSLGEKIEKIDQNLQLSQQFTSSFELIKLLLITIISIHLFGCGFHFVGDTTLKNSIDPDYNWIANVSLVSAPFTERYISSIYFAMITMTTIGYGDIHPVNVYEKMYVLGMSFITCGLFAFNLNFIGALISDSQKKAKEFRNRQYSMWCYMNDKQVKKTTQLRVLKYLEFAKDFEDSNIEEGAKILNSCSQEIREELLKEQFGRIIKSNKIFKTVFSKEFIAQLSLHMKERRFSSGEVMVSKGQQLQQLFFVTKGRTEYFYDNNNNDYTRSLCDHNEGVIDFKLFVTQQPSSISIKSKGITTVAFIDLAEWQNIIEQFTHDKEKECYLRDQFIYDKRYQFPCKSCGQYRHDIYTCPQVNYKVNQPIFFTKLSRFSTQEKRVFQSRKKTPVDWKPALLKYQQTMKAVKLIRWEYARAYHNAYDDIVVEEEIKVIERDKDFLLRCPRIKYHIFHKENNSFQDDAFTKIKLTDNSDNTNFNSVANKIANHQNNREFQSTGGHEEDENNYFISQQSSSSDSVSESFMSDSDNSKHDMEIANQKINKVQSNLNNNNNDQNTSENLFSVSQIPSFSNNITINGESNFPSYASKQSANSNMNLNNIIGISNTINNGYYQNNITQGNTHDRRQSKATMRAPRSDKLIEDPTEQTSNSSQGYEEPQHFNEKQANIRKSQAQIKTTHGVQLQNSPDTSKDKSGQDILGHSFVNQMQNIQQSLNNDTPLPSSIVFDYISEIIAAYRDKLQHLANQNQSNSLASSVGNFNPTQQIQMIPGTAQFITQKTPPNIGATGTTSNLTQVMAQFIQPSSPLKKKRRLMSKLYEKSSILQTQLQLISQQQQQQQPQPTQLSKESPRLKGSSQQEIEQKVATTNNICSLNYLNATNVSETNENKISTHLFGKCEFFFDLPKEYQFYYTKFNNSNVVKAYKKYQQLFKLVNNAKELGILEKSTVGKFNHSQTVSKRRYLKKATLAASRSKQAQYAS